MLIFYVPPKHPLHHVCSTMDNGELNWLYILTPQDLLYLFKMSPRCFFKGFFKNILFIYLSIYLFIFGSAGSQLRQAGSLVAACGIFFQLQHACGIQFPDQGSNLGPLHWEHGVLPTGPPGKSPGSYKGRHPHEAADRVTAKTPHPESSL